MASSPSNWQDPEYVTQEQIREMFNKAGIIEQVERGELKRQVLGYDNHLSARQRLINHEPKCTRSQIILFSTLNDKPVAIAHQYKRRDGTLGGSGRPDPKKLWIDEHTIAFSPFHDLSSDTTSIPPT